MRVKLDLSHMRRVVVENKVMGKIFEKKERRNEMLEEITY
jgi:hypothetical protein